MYRDFLLEQSFIYERIGKKILTDGTILYGNDKSIAPHAWLHQIYPPLEDKEIKIIEDMIGINFPNSIINFYKEMNGFGIFLDELNIYGLRKDFSRSIESVWQPFSIETTNKWERPFNAEEELIFIGSYSKNGNLIYINSKNKQIYSCLLNDANPIHKWINFKSFFIEEVSLIFKIHNKKYLGLFN